LADQPPELVVDLVPELVVDRVAGAAERLELVDPPL